MMGSPIRVLDLTGGPTRRGRDHGAAHAAGIRAYAADRLGIVAAGDWAGRPLGRAAALGLAARCLPAHERYAPDLYEEMVAIGDAAGLTPAEMIVVGGFTDFVDVVRGGRDAAPHEDTCTAFIVPDEAAGDAGFLGQTWDMHDSATEHVVMLRLAAGREPGALVFTTVGCVGQIGMNDAGVAVGINNLASAGRVGVTWPFVVRKALQQRSADDALACVLDADLAGAHNYLILDASGVGYDVEAMPDHRAVSKLDEDVLVHTNHCLDPEARRHEADKPPELMASSVARLHRAAKLLAKRPLDEADLMAVTGDGEAVCQRSAPPWHVESCGAAIMRPRTGDFWAVWGLPAENDYEHFSVGRARG